MKKRTNNIVKLLIISYCIMFFLISSAYSFLKEELTLKGTSRIVKKNLYEYSYQLNQQWENQQFQYYHFTLTVTYLDTAIVNDWQVNIEVPTNTEVVGCFNASECTIVENVLRIKNATWNGNLSPTNNTFSISYQIKTTETNVNFELMTILFNNNEDSNIPDIPTDPGEDQEGKVEGFTVNLLRENYWGNTTQYAISIDNHSELSLRSWILELYVPTNSTMANCWNASYILKDNILILSGPSWNLGLPTNTSLTGIGLQINTPLLAPATINVKSLKGITTTEEDVEMVV